MTEFTRLYEYDSSDQDRIELSEQFEPSAAMRAWVDRFVWGVEGEPKERKPAVFTRCLNGITSQSDEAAACGLVCIDGSGGRYLVLEDDFPSLMYQTTANEIYAPDAKGELDCFTVKIAYFDADFEHWINKVQVYVWYKGDLYELGN